MLFFALVFTYLISITEKQLPKHSQIGELFGFILLLSFIIHYINDKHISKENFVKTEWNFICIAPIWFLSFVLKKVKLKY